jgi:hypothetical protein
VVKAAPKAAAGPDIGVLPPGFKIMFYLAELDDDLVSVAPLLSARLRGVP